MKRPFFKFPFAKNNASAEPAPLADYILSFASQSADQRAYATTHLGRLVRTLELTPEGTASDRVLEMGAYMQITPALQTRRGYGEVRGCYLGPLGRTDQKSVTSSTGEVFRCEIDLFDAEKDVYPYPDSTFAAVVCCELLEHLSSDPMHLMFEVNRILRTGGRLILSTPNISALRSVAAVLRGEHPGLYQQFIRPRDGSADPRHAREYTPNELRRLFESSGFSIEALETGPYGLENPTGYEWAEQLLKDRGLSLDLRGDTVHIVGKKTGPVVDRYPNWLYD